MHAIWCECCLAIMALKSFDIHLYCSNEYWLKKPTKNVQSTWNYHNCCVPHCFIRHLYQTIPKKIMCMFTLVYVHTPRILRGHAHFNLFKKWLQLVVSSNYRDLNSQIKWTNRKTGQIVPQNRLSKLKCNAKDPMVWKLKRATDCNTS